MQDRRPLAVITGASSGIGMHLALEAAAHGYDLILAADEPSGFDGHRGAPVGRRCRNRRRRPRYRRRRRNSSPQIRGRRVHALLANAGRGLGKGFLDQDFAEVRDVIDTNITGTLYLIQRIARDMRAGSPGKDPDHGFDRGIHAGHLPGGLQRHQGAFSTRSPGHCAMSCRRPVSRSPASMPGATDTEFFARADLLDTKVGDDDHKADPADVATRRLQRHGDR